MSVQADASSQVPFDTANAAVNQAFAAWNTAQCSDVPGATPNIYVANLGPVECASVEFNKERGGNANIVVFRDNDWPEEKSAQIALTTVTYDPNTGEILGGDIELNSYDYNFTTDDVVVETDLVSILTHEAGHFLGFAHSDNLDATMYDSYSSGIGLRSLEADDIGVICAAYPPRQPSIDPQTCNPIPKFGFSQTCLSAQTENSCSVYPLIGTRQGSWGGLSMVPLILLARARRLKKLLVPPHS